MTKASISMIRKKETENVAYSLWKISISETEKFALHVQSRDEEDFDVLGDDQKESEIFLEKIADCDLSPIHLQDAARDHKDEVNKRRLGIF